MTSFFALIRKDLLLYVSDRRALILNIMMPVMLASFFGFLFGGSGDSKTSKIEVALVLQDTSDTGKKIAAGLRADAALKVSDLTLEAAETQVREGKLKAAIVIPQGFGNAAGGALFGAGKKPAIDLLYDPSQKAVLAMVRGMLTQQVMQIVSADMFGGKGGQDWTEKSLQTIDTRSASDPDSMALKDFLGSLKTYQARVPNKPVGATDAKAGAAPGGLAMPFSTSERAVISSSAEAGYNGYAHSFAGMSVQFILFMGINMGIEILLARRSGIWNRLLAAPVSLMQVLLARAASAALIALGLLTVIFLCAMVIFKVQISNVLGFFCVGAGFALMTAAFGLLIAAFGKTPEAARGLAVFATLIMVMLGGAWVPSFVFPEWIQSVTVVIPARWAVDGFDAVTWRGLGLEVALRAALVQLGFAALFGSLAIWKFNREQQ